jgi:hypothetical protein
LALLVAELNILRKYISKKSQEDIDNSNN